MQKKFKSMAEMIALGVGTGLHTNNFEFITEALYLMKKDPDVFLIATYDENKQLIGAYNPSNLPIDDLLLPEKNIGVILQKYNPIHIVRTPIIYENINYGKLILLTSLEKQYVLIRRKSLITLGISLSILFIGLLISFFFSRSITKPLISLEQAAGKIALGDYNINIEVRSKDELGVLGKSFNEMAEKIKALILRLEDEIKVSKQAEEEIKLKNDQLQKTNAEKDKFFSIIAHDLRSPLSGVLGLTEIIANDSEDFSQSELTELGKSMHQSVSTLFKLLENLLEWAQMQKGSLSFSPKEFDLFKLVSQSVDTIYQRAIQKGITLTNEIPSSIKVNADEKMINTVLRNFLSNAVKFTRRDGKVIVRAKTIDNQMVEVSVTDTGIGMSEKNVKKLFKIEEKVSSQGTEGEPSTGLGLLLCKEFVEKHDGKVWAESQQNIGSTFYFTLPESNAKNN
jgi:signal transduction histidine kinase